MPTITFSLKDLQNLVGKKLTIEEVSKLVEYGKGELENYNKEEDEITVDFGDTAMPYLWSVEGVARLTKGILNLQKGIPKIEIKKGDYDLIVDKSVSNVRPYIAAFVAKSHKVDDYLIKQMVQLQEKLCESYGRRRLKIAIGVYSYDKIKFPIHYKATDPESIKFTPLEFKKEMTQQEILEEHPKGKEYGHLISDNKVYPVFMDANKNILSLIPVINSEQTGKLQVGDDSLFFDTTGTDEESVNLVANIFAYALADRGFTIEQVTIEYPSKKVITPTLKTKTIRIKEADVEKVLGIKLKTTDIKKLLNNMGYEYNKGTVTIPSYRNDIMHSVDIIEDIAISYGYDNVEPAELTTLTVGSTFPIQQFIDTQRTLWIGLGYQEAMTAILANKEILYDKMGVEDPGTVEITNYVSQTYSCVRTWILPTLLNILSTNKHVDYPQKLFEQGLVTIRNKEAVDEQHLAAVTAHTGATFTEMRQAIETTLRSMGVTCTIDEFEMPCFIPGRAAKVLVNKKQVGYLGEIHPAVLERFNLAVPVAACELNLSTLFEEKK